MDNILEIRSLSKTYYTKEKEILAIANINLDIKENSITAIVGPSGCGKSTLLNIIGNLDTKTDGEIRFLNNKLSVISCPDAEDTVLKYLSSSSDSDGYAVIPVSMTMLAKMLGLGRASLYRSLDALEQSGNIIRENNKIKVIKK